MLLRIVSLRVRVRVRFRVRVSLEDFQISIQLTNRVAKKN